VPAPTYQPLATVTFGSVSPSVLFSSIPQNFKDLVLIINGSHSVNTSTLMYLNNDTGANYFGVRAQGNGSTTASDSYTTTFIALQQVSYTANQRMSHVLNFMDYSSSTKNKSVISRPSSANTAIGMEAHRWANNSAITSIRISSASGNFNAGTTMSIYGITGDL
jgi:hypothetical protein